ncbi:hypothetical protein [Planktotalea sp.]|uniref:hypothetical protein n=1 Tax=Planktotalea sp. TaxID=2029877 RepID=UPI0025F022A0|nr:hypothetical protein [Planktotalea sp.]
MPEAPEGWQRRGFDEGDNTSIVPNFNRSLRGGDWSETDNYLAKARKDTSGVSASPTPKGVRNMMKGQSADEFIEDVATRSWLYERGEETVFIEMRLKLASNQKSMAGLAKAEMNSVVSKMNQPAKLFGYSVISGVGFVELRGQSNMVVSTDLATHYRIIRAKIGLDEEVQLRVHANASQASTCEILHAIDFESMNNLLSMPMPYIRNGHQIPINVTEQDVVNAMSMLYAEARVLLTLQRGFAIRDMFVSRAPKIQIGEKNGQPVFAPIGSGNTEDLRTVIQESYRNSMLLVANGGSYESGKSSLTYNIQDAP